MELLQRGKMHLNGAPAERKKTTEWLNGKKNPSWRSSDALGDGIVSSHNINKLSSLPFYQQIKSSQIGKLCKCFHHMYSLCYCRSKAHTSEFAKWVVFQNVFQVLVIMTDSSSSLFAVGKCNRNSEMAHAFV
jgi:hypothetical protein